MEWVLEFLFLTMGSWFDGKDQTLPLSFLGAFTAAAILENVVFPYQSFQEEILGAMAGGIFLFVGWISRQSIGYGDGWVLVILGIMKGISGLIPVVLGAFLFSGVYGLWKLFFLKEERNSTMPFLPFLWMASLGVKIL